MFDLRASRERASERHARLSHACLLLDLRSTSHNLPLLKAPRQRTQMAEADFDNSVDDICDVGLDSGWEPVELLLPDTSSAKGAKSTKGSSAQDAYIIKTVQERRPRSSSDYKDGPRRPLPYPCLQSADSPLLHDPAAWACAGISVLYVAWHFMPLLVSVWKALNLPGGKPPCPRCWQHQVQLGDGRQLTVEQCYQQLSAAEIKQLQDRGSMGKTLCHGWLQTPYRAAGIGTPELLMAYQYQCKGCPVASTSGRKATKNSFFMATDKGLLTIMQQQGLGAYVDLLQLQRGPRVGINAFIMKLIQHANATTGSIKFFVDMLQELAHWQVRDRQLHRQDNLPADRKHCFDRQPLLGARLLATGQIVCNRVVLVQCTAAALGGRQASLDSKFVMQFTVDLIKCL